MPKTTYEPERITVNGKKIKNPKWTKETADPKTWEKRHPLPRNQESNPIPLSPSMQSQSLDLSDLSEENPQNPGKNQASRKNQASSSLGDTVPDAPVRAGEKDYKQFLEDGLPVFTWALGLLLGFILLRDSNLGSEIFGMSQEETDALAGPLASLLNKQKLPNKVKKAIVSSNDAIAIVAALGVYAQRVNAQLQSEEVREYVQRTRNSSTQSRTARRQRGRQPVTSNGAFPTTADESEPGQSNGHRSLPAYPGGVPFANV